MLSRFSQTTIAVQIIEEASNFKVDRMTKPERKSTLVKLLIAPVSNSSTFDCCSGHIS